MVRGFYVWYYVPPDAGVSYKVLNAAIKVSNVSIPTFRKPNPGNVFRRVCGEVNDKDMGVKLKALPFDKNEVIWSITSDTGETGTISINKKSFDIQADEAFGSVKDHIVVELALVSDIIHDQPIRESIRKALEGFLDGTPMKPSGGIYFVPLSKEVELSELMDFQSRLDAAFVTVVKAHEDGDEAILTALDYRLRETLYADTETMVRSLESQKSNGAIVKASQIIEAEKVVASAIAKYDEYSNIDTNYKDFFASGRSQKQAFETLLDRLNNI